MNEKLELLVKKLTAQNQTISSMESCTGGAFVNSITNIPGSSEVLKFSAVTYSNEFKIKMGVPKEIIDTYTVYSIETAIAMSKCISTFTSSDYGIGITGKLNRIDPHNLVGTDNKVYISIYCQKTNKNHNYDLTVTKAIRKENKEEVIDLIITKLLEII